MKIFRNFLIVVLVVLTLAAAAGCSSGKDPEYASEKEELLALLEELADYSGEAGLDNKLQSVGVAGKILSFLKKTTLTPAEIGQISGAWLKERTPEQQAALKAAMKSALDSAGDLLESGASQLLDLAGVDKEALKDTIDSILDTLK